MPRQSRPSPDPDSMQGLYEQLLRAGARIVVPPLRMDDAVRLAIAAKRHGPDGAHVVFKKCLVYGPSGVAILAEHAGRHATFEFAGPR